ncbi:hypothetical protein [Actinomycetospora flava]|uniref:Uncharacterized protein n=1 Tax=Actinomycetospora flava TaxID=3129232 RepID=A0ABU8LZB7_9PSEU
MEPTPIFADLVSTERPRPTSHGAHDGGRSVTDLLRELRDEAPRASRPASVGRVPGLLTFPARPGER